MAELTNKFRRKRIAGMPLNNAEVARRLKKIRHVLNYGHRGGQTKFALDVLDVANDRYSLWEKGQIEFPVYYAIQLIESGRLPGLTLDWIYRGGFDLLRDGETARALRAAPPSDEETEERSPSRKAEPRKTLPRVAPRKRVT